jgi:hypothetical protein
MGGIGALASDMNGASHIACDDGAQGRAVQECGRGAGMRAGLHGRIAIYGTDSGFLAVIVGRVI